MVRKKWLVIAFVLSLLGIVAAGISASEFFHIKKAGLEEPSFCSVNETINCDVINASSYAELFGIPVAIWGLLFYAVIAIFSLYLRISKQEKEHSYSLFWGLSVFGILWTLRMAYIASFILNAVCITCFAQYVINTLLLIAAWVAYKNSLKDKVANIFSPKIVVPGIVAASVFGIGYIFALSATNGNAVKLTDSDINEAKRAFFKQQLYDIKPADIAAAPTWGNPNAKITIVEFSDFQCPFCRVAAFNIKPYLQEFRNDVKLVFMNYPLDNSCNKYLSGPMHTQACIAARAAVCAQEKGKFWEYSEDVFRNQTKISRETLLNFAEKNGIDKAWMGECVDSEKSLAKVQADVEVGHHIYLTGTPSVFMNQRSFHYWRNPELLRAVIKEELKKNK